MNSDRQPGRPSTIDVHLVFVVCLGFFGLLHWLIYWLWWPHPAYFSTHLIGLVGLWLVFRPRDGRALVAMIVLMVIDGWLQAPVVSNHTMLKNFVTLGLLLAGVEALLRRKSFDWFLLRFAPYGALILVGLYFFGVFHKINSDFLDPEVSCAVALWHQMPIPAFLKHSEVMHWAGIYGTFIIETLIATCLLIPRLRTIGVVLGIAFHMLLAVSSYEFYSAFTVLTFSLHALFLHPKSHVSLLRDERFLRFLAWTQTGRGRAALIAYFGAVVLLAWGNFPTQLGVLVWIFVAGLLWVIWQHGRRHSSLFGEAILRSVWIPALVVLFYVSGFSPYLGGKTAQSFNMFANLSLEGGYSNHLVVSEAPGGYIDDVVEIESAAGSPRLSYIRASKLHLVYYDFLNIMERSDDQVRVTYIRNGRRFVDQTRDDLEGEFERVLHPRWLRKWFHFTPVDLARPKPCAVDR